MEIDQPEVLDTIYLRVRAQALDEERRSLAEAKTALLRQVQHLEDVVREADAQRQQAEDHLHTERVQIRVGETERLRVRVQDLEAENRRLQSESQTLWDDRYKRLVAENRQLARERDIAQGVAKVLQTTQPVVAPYAAPELLKADTNWQAEMLRLLRELTTMVRGEEPPQRREPAPDLGDTQVSFPPEPLWPDAFRASRLTTEDYARELGVAEEKTH